LLSAKTGVSSISVFVNNTFGGNLIQQLEKSTVNNYVNKKYKRSIYTGWQCTFEVGAEPKPL
jgi:hypothetical protein